MTIGIVDYGVGNLRSVQKALESVGVDAVILATPGDGPGLAGVRKLILPGVGAFADGMDFLRDREWIAPLREWVAAGRPILGICLGMQLLFEGSQEDALSSRELVPGLGILPGQVVRFREEDGPAGTRLKVPHMGWNQLSWNREDPLLAGLEQGAAVYFVHGYYPKPVETEAAPITSARADYGGPFTASVWRGNVWATQFHPEKSQRIGLQMLRNYARL